MSDENKNIFVSHQHNDADKIEAFKDLIGRHGINMRDSSIYENKLKNNAKNEQYIKQELIKPQMSLSFKADLKFNADEINIYNKNKHPETQTHTNC